MIFSVKNAIHILNCFSHETVELSLTDIAKRLDMNKSTVHHLLKTMYEEGVLEKSEKNCYILGKKVFEWGSLVSVRTELVTLSIPYIHELVNTTGETVHMAVLDQKQVLYIAKSGTPSSVRVDTIIGGRREAYCTALGKILLSYEPEDKIDGFLSGKLLARTQRTITVKDRLLEELHKVSTARLAVDQGEYCSGIFCLAAGISDAEDKCIAAISVCGTPQRMQQNRNEYVRCLEKSAQAISKTVTDSRFNYLKSDSRKIRYAKKGMGNA